MVKPIVVNIFQYFSEREAKVMKANSWLYHYYMVQSRLQYSLAYGGQSPSALAAFYPQSAFGGHQSFDGSSGLHPSAASAFLPQNSSLPHHPHPHAYASGYGYTPPPGAYQLQHDQVFFKVLFKNIA
jgi:hypothetical protein